MNLAPTVRPSVAFAPIIMNALENMPNDPAVKQFTSALGAPLTRTLLEGWKRVPGSERFRRYALSREWFPPKGDFATQMASQAKLFQTAREELITRRKQIIKAEVDRALTGGIGTYQPSAFVSKDALLSFEVAKKLGDKIFHRCVCEDPGNTPEPAPVKKFGLKVTRLKCHDQREAGNDEIYLVSAVVDGKGNLVTTTSARYEIDDDDDDVVYPNYYIYPMQDPGGFLDAAVAMWEDDGGYGEAGQRVAAIGNAVGKIPSPYTVAAGVALTIIGELISLASWLDDDDHYGDAFRTWPSQSALEAGVGSYVLSYYEVDDGWFDDGHDFDLTLNVLTA